MRTLRRLLYGELLVAVGFALLAFLALFSFFNFVDQLPSIGQASVLDPDKVYGLWQATLYVLLLLPNLMYQLLPITLLIGTVFVLVRMAQASEYTILRTSGLGPGRALRTLLSLGSVFVLLTFAVGDYLAPVTARQAEMLRASYRGNISVGQTGAWLKERQGEHQFSVNVGALDPEGGMRAIKIFEFDQQGRFVSSTQARQGSVSGEGSWSLEGVDRRQMNAGQSAFGIRTEQLERATWRTGITTEMLAAALMQPDKMRTLDLFIYIRHLEANNQNAQRYEIEFWRKVFYPLSCLVMVVLALPFAYLHFRSAGVAGYVFLGVMLGMSFYMLNNLFGYIGNLRAWQPWLAAASPAMVYSIGSLGAFGWLVLRR